MWRVLQFALAVVLSLMPFAGKALAQSRNALVIGNSAYQSAPALKTPATDAAIVAETLKGAGYDVTELHDVHQANIGQVMRDFLDKVAAGGPDGIAFVYYSGYGAQADGENYLVPIDAVINTGTDVPDEAFRLNDLLDALANTPLAARIVILDAARDHKLGSAAGKPVPKGLAMANTFPGTLLAFSAAPGAVSIDGDGNYSLFTGALVTMMRQPGLDMEQILKATRIEVNKQTSGAQTPWMVSTLDVDVTLFAPTAAAPEPKTTPSGVAMPVKQAPAVTRELMAKLTPDEAYAAALEEDTLEAYQAFVTQYPDYPLAAQVWATINTRREAVLWRRTLAQNTTRAYWNYLKRYPNGEHAAEAQEALAELSAPTAPPANYVVAPEPLPPDYYDEAVDLPEIVEEGYEEPLAVWDVIAPIFIRRPPPFAFDRRRRREPNRIPGLRGNQVKTFTKRTTKVSGDGKTDRKTKSGITSATTKTTSTKKTTADSKKVKKTGVTLPAGKQSTTKPGTTKPATTTTPTTTPGTRRPGLTLPPTTKPGTTGPSTTTPGTTAPGTRHTTTPGTTGPSVTAPTTTPGTRHPTTPGTAAPGTTVPSTTAPGTRHTTTPGTTAPTTTPSHTLPAVPGTKPSTTAPTPGQHPGLAPSTAHPTTPGTTAPTAGQHPGLAPSTTHPTAPGTTAPSATHPIAPSTTIRHPTPPSTTRPTAPSTTTHPTAPTTAPTTRRPPPPTAHPAPAQKLPQRPAPTVRQAPSRPAPVVRPAPSRPAPVARPAPARPAPPAARPAPNLPERKKR